MMDSNTTIVLQIMSILVSGGALQFATFLIKRRDDIHKLGHASPDSDEDEPHPARPTRPGLLFAPEKDLMGTTLAHEKEIAILKNKLRKCRRDLTAARKNS